MGLESSFGITGNERPMNTHEQITQYLSGLPDPKRGDMQELHRLILRVLPEGKLWFDEGISSDGKRINNPTIGYGLYTIHYAKGQTRPFFQIGLSANQTGISVYILGIPDKKYLAQTYGPKLGKASVTGYCIRFRAFNDIHPDVLEAAMRYGVAVSNPA
jgi:hypothetical protein